MRTVTGEIALPDGRLPPRAAEVTVRVEDVSRADAPLVVVGEQKLSRVRLLDRTAIPFAVTVPAGMIEERNHYSVRVHVDVSGTGEVSHGDLISTEAHPVLTWGHGDAVKVGVRRV